MSRKHMVTWWVVSIGGTNKTQYLQHSWALPNNLKHIEGNFSTNLLYLQMAHMLISRSGNICGNRWTDRQTDRTKYFMPCTCTRGNYLEIMHELI
jgi:hypothetical protein